MKINKLLAVLIVVFFVSMIPSYKQMVKSEYSCPTTLFVSCESLDFNRWSKNSNPSLSFIIFNGCNGILKGTLTPSVNWINLSETSFEGNLKEINVQLDVSNLSPGLHKEKIDIKSNGGDFTLPIQLDLVEKKVVILIAYDNPMIVVDSKPVLLDAASFIKSGWSYLPLRVICESFGAKVSFEYVGIGLERKKVITILHKDQTVKLFFNENFIEVNGINRNMDGPMEIRGRTAFVPLNTIKTIFDPIIQYNSKFRTITLVY